MYPIVVAFFLVSCQHRSVSENLAPSYSFPYVVSVQYLPDARPFGAAKTCTGSIIDKYWILTSAECIHGSSNLYSIQAGTKFVEENRGIIHNVSGIFVHPDYNGNQGHVANSVSLLKLVEPLVFNENISSIELGTLQSEDVIAVDYQYYLSSQALNFVLLNVMQVENCIDMHKEPDIEIDSRTHICASSGIYRRPCFVDLGGPLIDVTTFRLVGVFFGFTGCSAKYPDYRIYVNYFMKISEYIDWINSVTGLNLSLD